MTNFPYAPGTFGAFLLALDELPLGPTMSTYVYPVTDKTGRRLGDAVKRTDGVTRIRLDRPIPGNPTPGEEGVYLYVDPSPEILVETVPTPR